MSTQDGKTKELTLEELRDRAEAAANGEPMPELKAPEQEESKETEPAKEQAKSEETESAKQEEPALKGEPEPAKAAETTPAPEEEVPEKYRGKSSNDLLKILKDQESQIGKLGSEKSHEKIEADKFRSELDSLKSQFDSKKIQDQEETLKEGLEADPAKAIMEYIDQKTGDVEQKVEQDKLDRQTQEAQTYYNGLLENSDFKRRQSHVDKVAGALKQYVKADFLNSPGFIEVCDLVSKGTDINYYIQQSQTESASKKEVDLKEKREAQSISGSSSGQSADVKTAKPTLEELKQNAITAFSSQKE